MSVVFCALTVTSWTCTGNFRVIFPLLYIFLDFGYFVSAFFLICFIPRREVLVFELFRFPCFNYCFHYFNYCSANINSNLSSSSQVHYYVQSHIQINEYRDRVVLVKRIHKSLSFVYVCARFNPLYFTKLVHLSQPAATKKYGKHISKSLKVLDMTGLKLSALNQIKVYSIKSSNLV